MGITKMPKKEKVCVVPRYSFYVNGKRRMVQHRSFKSYARIQLKRILETLKWVESIKNVVKNSSNIVTGIIL